MKKYVVTYYEFGDSADHIPEALVICDTKEEAQRIMQEDMEDFAEADENYVIDMDNHCVTNNGDCGCQWNITTLEV